jgi:ubiquinone/menaquinone biosynthesis C-methylase UbiE
MLRPIMSFYGEQVLPRLIDFACSRAPIERVRERVAHDLHGEVLEIGFGSGLNLPHLPLGVTKLYAVDPSATGKRLASTRIAASPFPIEWSGLDGQNLVLPDSSVDCALSTFTLCTVPDLDRTLREVHRVLRPNGAFHFLEHGRSPDAAVATWQDRLTPLHRRVVGGCELNRSIADRLRAAGFCIDALENYYLPGPKVSTYIYEGRARACDHGPDGHAHDAE